MAPEEPKISDNARFGIGDAARLLGISRDTLRSHTAHRLEKRGVASFEVSELGLVNETRVTRIK